MIKKLLITTAVNIPRQSAEPGALGIGPLEAATLNPKLCLLGRRTKYALPM